MRVKCKECGKAFSTTSRVPRYCSDACRVDGRRRRVRGYMRKYNADPDKRAVILARTRAAAAARRARKRGGRPPRPRPLRAGGMRLSAAGDAKTSACGLCGRRFAPFGRTHHACCRRCTARADREVGRVWRAKCRECGKEFSATHSVVCYCSDACSASGRRRANREYRRKRAAGPKGRAAQPARTGARPAGRRAGKGTARRRVGRKPAGQSPRRRRNN